MLSGSVELAFAMERVGHVRFALSSFIEGSMKFSNNFNIKIYQRELGRRARRAYLILNMLTRTDDLIGITLKLFKHAGISSSKTLSVALRSIAEQH